jgi:hypothetical protein
MKSLGSNHPPLTSYQSESIDGPPLPPLVRWMAPTCSTASATLGLNDLTGTMAAVYLPDVGGFMPNHGSNPPACHGRRKQNGIAV